MGVTEFDLEIMALTVWAEARGEGNEGMAAVAWVIRHRWENPGWWSRNRGEAGEGMSAVAWAIRQRFEHQGVLGRKYGEKVEDDTIAAVCLDPFQFSCWNPSDPNRPRLLNPATRERSDYLLCRKICDQVLSSPSADDPVKGADHYCTKAVAKYTRWARGRTPVKVIGNHQFYHIGLSGG